MIVIDLRTRREKLDGFIKCREECFEVSQVFQLQMGPRGACEELEIRPDLPEHIQT